jgi:hypothetical protein
LAVDPTGLTARPLDPTEPPEVPDYHEPLIDPDCLTIHTIKFDPAVMYPDLYPLPDNIPPIPPSNPFDPAAIYPSATRYIDPDSDGGGLLYRPDDGSRRIGPIIITPEGGIPLGDGWIFYPGNAFKDLLPGLFRRDPNAPPVEVKPIIEKKF